MSSFSIQGGSVILPNDPTLPDDGIEWQPNDESVSISGNNYGVIQDVSIGENSVIVTTDSGTLTFSGPSLDEADQNFSDSDYEATTQNLNNLNPNLTMQLIELMAKISVTLSSAERTVREEERQSAFNKAMEAADKIMQGALTNLIMGVVAGAVSITAGVASVIAQAKAMTQMSEPVENLQMTKVESDVATVETDLRQTNLEIAQLKEANPNLVANETGTPNEQQLFKLEQRSSELKANRETISNNLQQKITKTQEQLDTANENVTEARNNLSEPPTEKEQAKLQAAQDKQLAINNRLNRLNSIKNNMDGFEPPPDPATITGDDVQAMQTEFDKTQNWQDSGMSYAKFGQQKRAEAYTNLNIVLQKIQQQVALTNAVVSVAQGTSQGLVAGGSYADAQGQAAAKRADAMAQQDQSRAQEADSDLNRNLDSVKKFLDLWDQISQMTNQAQRDILA